MMSFDADSPARWIALIVAGLAAGLLAALVQRGVRHDRAAHGPALRRLTRALGLSLLDRHTLRRLARTGNVRFAACLLISRGCFDAAVARANDRRLSPGDLARLRRRIVD
jgi:hypothetical protein